VETSVPVKTCNGITLPLPLPYIPFQQHKQVASHYMIFHISVIKYIFVHTAENMLKEDLIKRSRTTWNIRLLRYFDTVWTSVLVIGYTVSLLCDMAESETIRLRTYPCARYVRNVRVHMGYLAL
jgi:hypothetical protein